MQQITEQFGIRRPKKKIHLSRVAFIISFTIIPIINFLVFYVYVNFSSILRAFQLTYNGKVTWTLSNFTLFFSEFSKSSSLIREAFVNTGKSFLINECLFLSGFFVSYFLYKKIFGYKVLRTLFFLPALVSGTIVSSFFINIVSIDGPVAPLVQKMFGLDSIPMLIADSRYANKTIFANMIWLGIPSNMLIWGGTFSRIPDSVLESGKLDGVGWLREAFSLIMPMVWPTFALQFMLTIAGFFAASGSVFLLTQGELGTMTISCWLYLQVYNNVGNVEASNTYNYMSAIGLLMTSVTLVIVLVTRKLTNMAFKDVDY